MSLLRAVVLACGALLVYQGAFAADIRPAKTARGERLAGIMIEGEITKGDYAKFANAFIDNRDTSAVYLYSPGGDFNEALKIGRLIHALKLTTWAPMAVETAGLPMNEVRVASNKVCASSCFFMFAAGAQRFGDVVGIHRPYLPRDTYRGLSMGEAGQAHVVVRQMVEQYLKDIDVSASYVDRIMLVDSGDIEWLSEQELKKHFHDYAPAYREWVAAKCSPPSEADNARMLGILKSTPPKYNALPVAEVPYEPAEKAFLSSYFARQDRYNDCRSTLQRKEIDRLWAKMFMRRMERKEKRDAQSTH